MRRPGRIITFAAVGVLAAALLAAPASAAPPATVSALAPSVLLFSSDTYRPEAAATFVTDSTLRWAHDSACTDDPIAARGQVDAAKLGDGVYHDSTTTAWPSCKHNADSYTTTDYTRPRSGVVSGEGFFLDLDNAKRAGAGAGAPVYYEYKAHAYVTYWFFYAFNNAVTTVADHEGDWERVSIRLDANDRPLTIAYYQHTSYCTMPYASAPSYQSHPVAYSATGTHASFPTAGSHGLDRTDAGPRWNTTANLLDAHTQPWYGYGGAWGEVGDTADSTGPLGPSAYKSPAPTDWDKPC